MLVGSALKGLLLPPPFLHLPLFSSPVARVGARLFQQSRNAKDDAARHKLLSLPFSFFSATSPFFYAIAWFSPAQSTEMPPEH